MSSPEALTQLLAALEERHLKELTFQEVRRAIAALSAVYVERRERLQSGRDLDGRGKRAAFALFYGPLHFLTVRHVVVALEAFAPPPATIFDLGCGTGVGAAAWAQAADGTAALWGCDNNRWALGEARWLWQRLGLSGTTRPADLAKLVLRAAPEDAVIAAYTVNELDEAGRRHLLGQLLAAAAGGSRVLVVEPIARRGRNWWQSWESAFVAAGGRVDTWRFDANLPERLRLFDKAAGLNHRELTARTLYLSRGKVR